MATDGGWLDAQQLLGAKQWPLGSACFARTGVLLSDETSYADRTQKSECIVAMSPHTNSGAWGIAMHPLAALGPHTTVCELWPRISFLIQATDANCHMRCLCTAHTLTRRLAGTGGMLEKEGFQNILETRDCSTARFMWYGAICSR